MGWSVQRLLSVQEVLSIPKSSIPEDFDQSVPGEM